MLIYHYDQFTRVLLGSSEADENPDGGFLVPAFATDVAPPVIAEGEHAVFDGAAWAVQADTASVDKNLTAAPETLFGGPTIKETFNG